MNAIVTDKHPAKLLTDNHGVYGVGIGDLVLAVRPDRAHETTTRYEVPVFQAITYTDVFKNSLESTMARRLIEARMGEFDSMAERSDKDRRKYFAVKRSSFGIINHLTAQALDVVPQPFLQAVRRFPPRGRSRAFSWAATSERRKQILTTFPILPHLLQLQSRTTVDDFFENLLAGVAREDVRNDVCEDVEDMIERGAQLKAVAMRAGVPLVFRHVKPGAVNAATEAVRTFGVEMVADFMRHSLPSSTQAQQRWFGAVNAAHSGKLDATFYEWVARYALEFGTTRAAIRGAVFNIRHWAENSYAKEAIETLPARLRAVVATDGQGYRQVGRIFTPQMAPATASQLAANWAADVALANHDTTQPLPPAWRERETVDGLDFIPLDSAADIVEEGRLMRNCLASRIASVANGMTNLFSVRDGVNRLATVEVERTETGKAGISEMRAFANAEVPKATARTIRKWLARGNWNLPPQQSPIDDMALVDLPF